MAVRTSAVLALAAAAGTSATVAVSESSRRQEALSVSGVQKVIGMLSDMLATSKQEKHDEGIAFAKFKTWCGQEQSSLKGDITRNDEAISMLSTEIDELHSSADALAAAVAKLEEQVASDQADSKDEAEKREKARKVFLASQQDFQESLSAIERATEVLSKQKDDRPGSAAALLQLSSTARLPERVKSVVVAFAELMGNEKDPMNYQAPEANAYEFQSQGLVDTMKMLNDQFRSQLSDLQKGEMNSQHAYDMVKLSLEDNIANSNKDAAQKTAEKDRKLEKKAQDEKDLAATKDVKAANEKALADTSTECSEKDMSYQEKQNLRSEEIEAIGKAIEILSSPEVTGNAEKYLDLVQQGKIKASAALVQERRSYNDRRHVREYLSKESSRLSSKRLGLLVEQIAADPFAKVKGLIDNMITRLEEEANADAVHEGYCDTELGKSKITRTRLSEEIDALDAAIDDGKATIMALSEDTKTLSQEVAQLETAMAEATTLRQGEHNMNADTVKDAKAAQSAVQAATAVLKDFYAKAMSATALVQDKSASQLHARVKAAADWGLAKTIKMGSDEWNALTNPNFEADSGHKAGMQTFGAATQGQQDESNFGVLPMLEVIHSDFANLEADTVASEQASKKAYDDFVIESRRNKAVKSRKVEMNNADQASTEAKLQSDIADLKATQDELLAADRYHAILVPKCVDKGQTYEERTKSREAEMASLKQALQLLGQEDINTSA